MADDPNRDILPVKDDSCYGSVRCFSEIDPRERHVVCKLDRYQLEDRYLRLLEDVQGLKKLSNSQEDKIKRLTTKLMRSAASSRTCPAILAINDEREKIARLELENSRLKDKTCTLRNQLQSHRCLRSPSRCRRVPSGISSGPTTYRSESARTKYQSQPRNDVDDNDAQNYLVKIEELETQRNELMTRVTDLENQIAVHVAGIQREKVQDNVENIRMWRQMKQANDKLVSVQAANDTLHGQVADLKKLLEETTKNNREITAALISEKQRLSDIDDQISSAKDSQLSIREKEEIIRDLKNEMKILQQHNNELIALSSKFGQVELENIELKRKVSEYAQDNQSLKSAFSSEQADHAALRVANDKLIDKIEILQKNMDHLNMQLVTFQNQGEKGMETRGTQTEVKQVQDKKIGTTNLVRNEFVESREKEKEKEEEEKGEEEDAEYFVDERKLRYPKRSETVKTTKSKPELKNNQSLPIPRAEQKHSRIISSKSKYSEQKTINSPSMSREKILMLLDQAQISTPLEAQNAARIRQIDVAAGQNDASIFPENYRYPLTIVEGPSNDEFASTNKLQASTASFTDDRNYEEIDFIDPKEMLLTIFQILKSYSENCESNTSNSSKTCRSNDRIDSNYKNCAISYEDLLENTAGNDARRINDKYEINKERNLLNKFTETMSCRCDSNQMCSVNSDCGYGCCSTEIDNRSLFFEEKNYSRCPSNPIGYGKTGFGKIGSIKKTFDSIYAGRFNEADYDCGADCFETKPLRRCDRSTIDKSSINVSEKSAKLKKKKSKCETDCPTSNECGDIRTEFCEISQLPFIVTRDQGLVEIHILALQISAKATQNLFENDPQNISTFVSVEVWGQETAFTPILKYPSLNFDSSSVYRVCDLKKFFDSVLRKYIVFQVNVIKPGEETIAVAKAELSVKDILDYPQNKLHYVTPLTSLIPCPCDGNFGQLSLWIRLSCDINLIENFKDRCGLINGLRKNDRRMWLQSNSAYRKDVNRENCSGIEKNDAIDESFDYHGIANKPVLRDFMDELTEVQKNKTRINNRLETIREDASREKIVTKGKYRNEDFPPADYPIVTNNDTESHVSGAEVENKKLGNDQRIDSGSVTEFNYILKNKNDQSSPPGSWTTEADLGTVIADDKWQKYKRNSPTKSDASYFENSRESWVNKNTLPTADTITISIVTMTLFDKTSLMNNPEVNLLYIEYSFLGMHGADMETISLPKPRNKGEVMTYNFTRKFKIDDEYHNSQRNTLISMLTGTASPIIRFVIVSEPLPEEVDVKECVEVGHADLNIREYALGDGLRDVPLIIMNPSQSEQFGMLKITIDGIEIIRNCMMVQKRL